MNTGHNRHGDEPVVFEHGRAYVDSADQVAALDEQLADGGRDSVLNGACSLSEWLVWDWTRQTDERLEQLIADVYDTADRVHYLSVTVICVFLVVVAALSVTLGLVLL